MGQLQIPLHIQVSGEFEIKIKDKNGNIKRHIPKQKNLLLENFYKVALKYNNKTGIKNNKGEIITISEGSENTKNMNFSNVSLLDKLLIGEGNQSPQLDQIKLDKAIKVNDFKGAYTVSMQEPTSDKPNIKTFSIARSFVFRNIGNRNITEIGICHSTIHASTYNITFDNFEEQSRYVLFTRALIKNEEGHPTALTLTNDELLEITYTFTKYIDLTPVVKTLPVVIQKNRLKPDLNETKNYDVLFQSINTSVTYESAFSYSSSSPIYLAGEDSDEDISADYDLEKRWSLKYSLPEGQRADITNPNIYLHQKTKDQVTRDLKNRFLFNINDSFYKNRNDFYDNNTQESPRSVPPQGSETVNYFAISEEISDGNTHNVQSMKLKIKPFCREFKKGIRAFIFKPAFTGGNSDAPFGNADCSFRDFTFFNPWILAFKEQSTGLGLVKPMGYILEIDFKFTLNEYQG